MKTYKTLGTIAIEDVLWESSAWSSHKRNVIIMADPLRDPTHST